MNQWESMNDHLGMKPFCCSLNCKLLSVNVLFMMYSYNMQLLITRNITMFILPLVAPITYHKKNEKTNLMFKTTPVTHLHLPKSFQIQSKYFYLNNSTFYFKF